MIKTLAIKDIELNGGTQQRPIDELVVARYAALMADGFAFPPVDIIYNGSKYYLWDGFHRWHATHKNKKNTIDADVVDGTQREAIYKSFGANKANGTPRQKGVAAHIVEELLADEEWKKMTQRDIAIHVGVTAAFVSQIKKKMEAAGKETRRADTVQVEREGKTFERKKSLPPKIIDSVKTEIPERLEPIFNRVDEIKILAQALSQLLKRLEDAKVKNDELYHHLKLEPVKAMVEDLRRTLKAVIPYAVCPYCSGDGGPSCINCSGLGWVTKMIWDAIPDSVKAKEKE